MGPISDRGKRFATYMRTHTASPFIRFMYRNPDDEDNSGFQMPAGLNLRYTCNNHAVWAVSMAREMRDLPGINGVLYGKGAQHHLEDAVVILPLRSYTDLIAGHIERSKLDREGTE